jgi:hypothetical protein
MVKKGIEGNHRRTKLEKIDSVLLLPILGIPPFSRPFKCLV